MWGRGGFVIAACTGGRGGGVSATKNSERRPIET